MHVLAVPGRHSGVFRSTPVSLLTVDGHRYIVAGLDDADWVLNARAAGRGMLRRGRTEEHVSLVELPVEDRAPILREFPRLIPQGVPFFTRLYGVSADPEQFAGLAETCPVFRVERRVRRDSDLTNYPLPRSIYRVMMEQNGGSDAQLFHDRTRSRDAAAGAGTVRRGGYASRAGEPHPSHIGAGSHEHPDHRQTCRFWLDQAHQSARCWSCPASHGRSQADRELRPATANVRHANTQRIAPPGAVA